MKNSDKTVIAAIGIVLGAAAVIGIGALYTETSTNDACMSCHWHSDSDARWKQSSHFLNASGTKADCAQCHLPRKGTFRHFMVKTGTGARDLMSYVFKKPEDIDWDAKSELEYARTIVYNESCKACHHNIFPEGLSDDGVTAHLHYEENEQKLGLQCISCHLDVGHYNPNYSHGKMVGVPVSRSAADTVYLSAARPDGFCDFTETVPGTSVSISMKAVHGGTFNMGSSSSEAFHSDDEAPVRSVEVSDFFMGETEVTWDQYWAFYAETKSEGRIAPEVIYEHNGRNDIDAVSGPTPPYGNPDQGWGMGDRPAITMTHYAAQTFCQWLSMKTGKHYRLPTEAEWEYAARGGSAEPYFFGGNPRKYSSSGFMKGVFKPDTTVINGYAVYALNSKGRTAGPSNVKPNPFGLRNMYGNVMEYCSDWYSPDAYASMEDGIKNPTGPAEGTEHVVRGGSYADDAALLRSAARAHTYHDDWLRTDPQIPKSIWWYSDVKAIGFRVVCEINDQ